MSSVPISPGAGKCRFYRQAESAAARILEAFQSGNVPKALAPIFVRRKDNVPCRAWSWSNQLLTALAGHSDARGYRQWQEVGRHVKKGEKAFNILVPCVGKHTEKDPDTGEEVERSFIYGFTSAPVFGFSQTDGDPLPPPDPEVTKWLESLPVREVAESWGLSVDAYNGRPGGALGKYRHGAGIALGVQNLSTWAHELCHAADDRLGQLKERGQHWRSETVAELGGAVLLEILGYETASDRGGCWEYVQSYAKDAGIEPVTCPWSQPSLGLSATHLPAECPFSPVPKSLRRYGTGCLTLCGATVSPTTKGFARRYAMSRVDRFDNYQTITARFDSTGACGHLIKRGDKIGWNRRAKKAQCAACWQPWCGFRAE